MGSGQSYAHPQQGQRRVQYQLNEPMHNVPIQMVRRIPPPQIVRQPTVNMAQAQPIVMQNDISLKNAKLISDGTSMRLHFQIDTLNPSVVSIFGQCVENVIPMTLITVDDPNGKISETQKFEYPLKNFEYISKFTMNVGEWNENQRSHRLNYWPLIIRLVSYKQIQSNSALASMFYYYEIDGEQIKQKYQKYQCSKGAFEINEIYGINDSGLVGNRMNEQYNETCTICISEDVDTIIMPCRHMSICNTCAHLIQEKKMQQEIEYLAMTAEQRRQPRSNPNTCPVCRKDIQSFIRLKKVANSG